MKKLSKKMSGLVLVATVFFSLVVFNSCQTEDENVILDEQNTKPQTEFTKKSDCDCDLILQADVDGSGTINVLDLILLQQIYLFFDYDGDGCVEYVDGTISPDMLGWITSGDPVPSQLYNYNGDNVVDQLDVREAFFLAEQFGAISGDGKLCPEDLECIRKYLLGVIVCD